MINQALGEIRGQIYKKIIMYLGKRNILNPERHEMLRNMTIEIKSGAVANAFTELEGLINKTQLAQQYFGRTHSWLSQKLNGCMVLNQQKAFTEAEYKQMAEAFRHIAGRLMAHADEIDNAKMDDWDQLEK